MKKAMRWCLILGSLCCLFGIGIFAAGAVSGGMKQLQHGGRYLENHVKHYGHRYSDYIEYKLEAFGERLEDMFDRWGGDDFL